jgi:DNA polymerase-3 subunit epsilon
MDFVVIDVETANPNLSSICQVGIASFRNGELVDSWESLINPEDYFSPFNMSIHGIDEFMVEDAPTWRGVFPEIESRLRNRITVSHTPFDRSALAQACERFGMQECKCSWLDSARVVRMAWPQFSRSGYGLTSVAKYFGIEYQAHDALEDARCAGLLLLRAIAETGLSPEQWLARVEQPIYSMGCGHRFESGQGPCKRVANPEGRLFGETLVFTGKLSTPRPEAADAAAAAGCCVEDAVTKHTTMLIVGDQDIRTRLAGHQLSTKHLKAERLIAQGQRIRILGESDFIRIVSSCSTASELREV